MPRQPKTNQVTRIEPADPAGHEPSASVPSRPHAAAPPGHYYHPHTGDLVPMPNDPGHAGPPSRRFGGFQAAPGEGLSGGQSESVMEGRYRTRTNADGSTTTAFEGRVYLHEAKQQNQPGRDGIPDAMSKRRIALAILASTLVLMAFIDLAGAPHVRVEPGVYASLEGKTVIDNPDAPLVILHRLDRSVFLYTFDGIGWAFSRLGGD